MYICLNTHRHTHTHIKKEKKRKKEKESKTNKKYHLAFLELYYSGFYITDKINKFIKGSLLDWLIGYGPGSP